MGKKPLTFEEAMARLEQVVEEIEQGKVGLEESIRKYEEGMELVRQCREILSSAEMKIAQLQLDKDGALNVQPFSVASAPPSESADKSSET